MLTYKEAASLFSRRKKGTNRRRVYRDCWLYQGEDDQIIITHDRFVCWSRTKDAKGHTVWNKTVEEVPMARITKDNILTLHLARQHVNLTTAKRLTGLSGLSIYADKRKFSAYDEYVRIAIGGARSHHSHVTVPYFPGVQLDLNLSPSKRVLNPKEDVKKVVTRSAANAARTETAKLAKLAKVMVALGSFDEFAAKHMDQPWALDKGLSLDDVNTTDPTGSDAERIVMVGAAVTARVDRYEFDANQKYVPIPQERRMRKFLNRAVVNGMTKLRRKMYEDNGGYEQITC